MPGWDPKWGTFGPRLDQLAQMVGDGTLTGTVERDQAYAQFQHESLDLRHPHGGQAKYQEAALLAHHRRYLQTIADRVLDGGIVAAMAEAMEQLDADSAELTPKETAALARSGHPRVASGGETVYDRPPQVHRLSPAELRAAHTDVRGRRRGGR